MNRTNPLLTVSQEGLYDYRNPLLRGNLDEIIAKVRAENNLGIFAERLPDMLKLFFGMKVDIQLYDMRSPAMILFVQTCGDAMKLFTPRQISDNENLKGVGFNRVDEVASGWFNAKTFKVGGVFSETPVTIYLANDILTFTDEEIGVAILHEVGHFIDYVVDMTTQYRHFGVVESMVRGIRAAPDEPTLVKFVKDAGERYDFIVEKPGRLKLAETDDAIRVELYRTAYEYHAKMALQGKGNFTREFIADELPAAIYGPRSTALALSKLLRMASSPAYMPMLQFHGPAVISIAMIIFGAGTLLLPIAALGCVTLAFDTLVKTDAPTHPTPIERLRKMRNLLLSDSKNPNLTRQQVTKLTEDVAFVDQLIDSFGKMNKTLISYVTDLFSRKPSSGDSLQQLEQALGELQNNPFFLRAAQIRQFKD